MFDAIEKLLILQDRDRKLAKMREEMESIEPQRQQFRARLASARSAAETGRNQSMQLESERKRIELDVESRKQQILKYSQQQLQTRKNEEYRALANEIETCKQEIVHLEDQEIEIMEKTEAVQKQLEQAQKSQNEVARLVEEQISNLTQCEQNLKRDFQSIESERAGLAAAVDENVLARYERLIKNKSGDVVVGINHGVCGGCHMKVPTQILVQCKAQQEVIGCPNCGRLLYYTRDMDLTAKD
jgi:predicted  nucleic acid-binding Zn-ribbon protein